MKSNKYLNLIVIAVILLGVWARITFYGSPFLSVGMLDTQTYIDSSKLATSLDTAFTGRRLLTFNLLYKLIGKNESCELTAFSNPSIGEEGYLAIQPCFNNIVLLQNIVSIFGWSLLAWTMARRVKTALHKISITIIILAFGFAPQIAEWDSILSSESLSVSLFPIVFAITQEIVFRLAAGNEEKPSTTINLLVMVWVVIFFFWQFVRDTHVYAVLTTLVLTLPFLPIKKVRQTKAILVLVVVLVGLFILGNRTAAASSRWQNSLTHVLDAYIFPHPSRTNFFIEHGMPENRDSEAYRIWFDKRGVGTYGLFLVSHPGFLIISTLDKTEYLRSDFIQPHFKSPQNEYRGYLLDLGEIVHPETNAVYLIDLILFLSILAAAVKYRNAETVAWTWLAVWMLMYSTISLFVTLYGDIDGTRRHIYPSVELFRLFAWIFLAALTDLFVKREHYSENPNN